METHVGPSVGASMTRKKSVTKMKFVQTHDSDLDVVEDWVTFIKLGGRSRKHV